MINFKLTPAERDAALAQAGPFLTEVTAYKAFLKSHDLPLTLDTTKLLDIYRGRLFEQLLAADTGLKARYDMARTTEGKHSIQVDTMAGISLKGHELPEQLAEAQDELSRAFRSVPFPNEVPRIELATLAAHYGFDYSSYIAQYTMNWEGMEGARAFFEQLTATFNQWHKLVAASGRAPMRLAELFEEMSRPFNQGLPANGPIVLNEKALYNHLVYRQELVKALAAQPTQAPALAVDMAKLAEAMDTLSQQRSAA